MKSMNNRLMTSFLEPPSRVAIIVFLISLGNSFSNFAQKSVSLSLNWEEPKVITQGDRSITVPSIVGQYMNGDRPNYFWQKRIMTSVDPELSLVIESTDKA